MNIHHSTVTRALERKEDEEKENDKGSGVLAPYQSYIQSVVEEHPHLTATRLHHMVRERGYKGSIYPIRRFLKKVRPKKVRAYQDLHWIQGEAAQVDWGDFGKVEIAPGSWRRLQLFAIVLCHSRALYAQFFYDQKTAALLEGHVNAFEHWGGCPRIVV